MKTDVFLTHLNAVIKYLCGQIDAEDNAIQVAKVTPKSGKANYQYKRDFRFADETFRISLHNDIEKNILYCKLIDIVIERIERISSFLQSEKGGFFLQSAKCFCTAEQWAEDIYVDLQNTLIQTFQYGLGLEFKVIDLLSTQMYEGAKSSGGLVFIEEASENSGNFLSVSVNTKNAITFKRENVRQIRKLLAGAGENGRLLFQRNETGNYICKGYCSEEGFKNSSWSVHFLNAGKWELFCGDYCLFRISDGEPKVNRDHLSTVIKSLKREFEVITVDWESKAKVLLESAKNQKHGTALVFLDMNNPIIKKRVAELFAHHRAVEVTMHGNVLKDAVRTLSGMDGAILVDVNTMSVSHVAVIVDGRARVDGSLDRGARHNSLKTFVSDLIHDANTYGRDEQGKHAMIAATIFSEDGGVVTVCGCELRKEIIHVENK